MQNTSPAHDATLLSAARAFVALDDAFSIIGDGPADNQALDARLGAIWEPRMAALGEVTTTAAGSPEAVRWKAEALRRLLAAEGVESRAEELALSLVTDILRLG